MWRSWVNAWCTFVPHQASVPSFCVSMLGIFFFTDEWRVTEKPNMNASLPLFNKNYEMSYWPTLPDVSYDSCATQKGTMKDFYFWTRSSGWLLQLTFRHNQQQLYNELKPQGKIHFKSRHSVLSKKNCTGPC